MEVLGIPKANCPPFRPFPAPNFPASLHTLSESRYAGNGLDDLKGSPQLGHFGILHHYPIVVLLESSLPSLVTNLSKSLR